MIYSNKKFEAENGMFVVARDSKGEPILSVASAEGIYELEECRSLKGYNIVLLEGVPTIVPAARREDERIFLILSAESQYGSDGNGHIMVPRNSHSRVIKFVKYASDKYANAEWSVVVLEVYRAGDIFRVIPAGFRSGSVSATFFIVDGGKVYSIDQPDIYDFYEQRGRKPPYGLFRYNESRTRILTTKQWESIDE